MTQKRGLGRGLGALIPGAGSTSAPEQELRTRTRPADETEGRSGSTRPVDMFFSGERVDADGRPQRGRADALDLATGMARAAAERRGRTASSTRAAAASGSKAPATETAEEEPTTRSAKAPARSSSSASSGTTAKKPATKTAGTKSTASKASAAKTDAAKSTATKSAPAKSTAAKSAPAKPAAAKPAATKTTAAKKPAGPAADATTPETASPAAASTEDSPVVDVEPVTPSPAKTQASEPAETPAPVQESDSAVESDGFPADGEPLGEPGSEQAADGASPEQGPTPALSAVSQDLVSVPGAVFAEIPIHEVRENPRNPRTMFDEDELDELAYSLREVGVLQPVVVRPIPVTEAGESFELVMGERRWRAARRAGLPAIPAIIRETSDDDLLRDALLENLHRTQLNPLEEANAYQQLLEDFGCTQDELGERIGRSRPQITNTLRLLRLPPLVQRRLASGAISAGHARALLSLDDPHLMEELAQRIVQEGLSVRAVERLVAGGGQQPATRTVRRSTYDPHVVDLTSRLSNRLEAPVRIDVGKRKGRITLEFSNLEDLERLVENMGLDVPLPHTDH